MVVPVNEVTPLLVIVTTLVAEAEVEIPVPPLKVKVCPEETF